jgi:hypothetical protein
MRKKRDDLLSAEIQFSSYFNRIPVVGKTDELVTLWSRYAIDWKVYRSFTDFLINEFGFKEERS